MADTELEAQSPGILQYKLDTLLVTGYIRKHSVVSLPSKLLPLFINFYHLHQLDDPLYSVTLIHDQLHRFFRRRPTMDDIENVGILPNGTSHAMFEHEIHSRLNRIGAHDHHEPDLDPKQSGRRSSIDMLEELDDVNPATYMKTTHSELERELETLRETASAKTAVITSLEVQQQEMEETISSLKEREQEHKDRIEKLEMEVIEGEEALQKAKARQSIQLRQSIKKETELEMDLANVQIANEQLEKGNEKSKKHLLRIKRKGDALETKWESMIHQKVEMLQRTNEQIDELRAYLKRSQAAYAHHRIHHYLPSPQSLDTNYINTDPAI